MNTKKISVIIPVYNEEKYLGRCLQSLEKQTSKPYEVIVVDNNSTDKTTEVAKRFGVRILKCEKQGISSARNYGAKAAKGEIISFIDADGIVGKDWVASIKKYFLTNEKKAIICGMNIFENKNPFKLVFYNAYNLVTFPLTFLNNLIGKYFVTGNNMAIKKELFFAAGEFPNYIAEDIKLGMNLRKFKNLNIKSSLKMRITYSSRRFDKNGFFRTLLPWIQYSFFKDKKDEDYKEDY